MNEPIVNAEHGANVNINRLSLPPARELIVWLLLGVSLAGNVFNWYYSHDAKTQAWLAEDAFDKMQSGPLADLRSQAKTDEALINAYGLRQQCQKVK